MWLRAYRRQQVSFLIVWSYLRDERFDSLRGLTVTHAVRSLLCLLFLSLQYCYFAWDVLVYAPKDGIFNSNIPFAVPAIKLPAWHCPLSAMSGGEFDGRLQQMEYSNWIFRLWAHRLNWNASFILEPIGSRAITNCPTTIRRKCINRSALGWELKLF